MRSRHNIVTAIEFGTAKTTVFAARCDNGQVPQIIGYCSLPSGGTVVKGEIQDVGRAYKILAQAIKTVEKNCGLSLSESSTVTVLVTGCGISSQLGVGTAKARDEVITEQEIASAFDEAKVLNLAADREIINCASAFSLVDGRRVSNPLNQRGITLETHIHIVHAVSIRIHNFRDIVANFFDPEKIFVLFSPLAADIGILSEKEKQNGVLLIDIGAGCTEYVVEYEGGVRSSGMLQIGLEHVANDISIAYGLHINSCRKLLESGELDEAFKSGRDHINICNQSGKELEIKVADLITITDARLEEIFAVIAHRLKADKIPNSLESGGVITGGGAKLSRTAEAFEKVFSLRCAVRSPADVGGAITAVKDPSFSAVWGALKFSAEQSRFIERKPENWLDSVASAISDFVERIVGGIKKFLSALKF